ncbi:MAG: hypothetical protein NVSMB18_24890 [Acetobacteraceae bacterium]
MRLLAWAAPALVLAASAQARTLEVGSGKAYALPSAAAAAAQEGDHIQIQPGHYEDCTFLNARNLVIEGMGDASKVVLANKVCGYKAILITVGDGITVRNLTLTGAKIVYGNGAGIRGEGRDLVVEGVRFIDNQNGILSGTIGGSMQVRDSLFDRDGACIGACAHGVYVGHLDRLVVERSRFLRTQAGHAIKSRAQRTEVSNCTIRDEAEGTSSYAVEAPNGGALLVRGNTIQKGRQSGNPAIAISIGAEGNTQPTPEILIERNQFRNDGATEAALLTNLSETPAVLRGNTLAGRAVALRGKGDVLER